MKPKAINCPQCREPMQKLKNGLFECRTSEKKCDVITVDTRGYPRYPQAWTIKRAACV